MTPDNKSVYERRDFLLGEIHERTKSIPQMQEDIGKLNRKVAVVEVKSGFFGVIGGAIFAVGMAIKHYFTYN